MCSLCVRQSARIFGVFRAMHRLVKLGPEGALTGALWHELPALFIVAPLMGTFNSMFQMTTHQTVGRYGGPEQRASNFATQSLGISAATFLGPIRVGLVHDDRLKDGRICLLSRGYVPQRGPAEKLTILGSDTADLIATIDHNLYDKPAKPRVQRKVMYDNVPVEAAREFQILAAAQSQELLEALDRWLSHRDRDVNPASKGTGRVRVGLGLYHFEERLDKES